MAEPEWVLAFAIRLLYHAKTVSDPREEKFRQMAEKFPGSPLGHYSLGRYYVEQRRFADAIAPLERACELEKTYAAALVCLGEAYAGADKVEAARKTFTRAKEVALEQKHDGLAEEIQEKIDFL